MSTPSDVIAARKLNQAKYALEDFDDGVQNLTKAAMVYGCLALALGLSLIFAADNLEHLYLTLGGAAGLFLAARFDYLPFANLLALIIAYFALLGMEWVTFGLPEEVLPFLDPKHYQGVPIVLNQLTPFVYWMAKVACSIYVLRLLYFRQKIYAQPEELMRKVAGERVV